MINKIPCANKAVLISPTVLLKLYIGNKMIGTGRALGDTGAHPNIIVHKIIKYNYSKTSTWKYDRDREPIASYKTKN